MAHLQQARSASSLAVDTVRFVGEPVAALIAESRAIARSAINAIMVDYQDLPSVTGPDARLQLVTRRYWCPRPATTCAPR